MKSYKNYNVDDIRNLISQLEIGTKITVILDDIRDKANMIVKCILQMSV